MAPIIRAARLSVLGPALDAAFGDAARSCATRVGNRSAQPWCLQLASEWTRAPRRQSRERPACARAISFSG
jgi:hypothetical protein